MALKKACCNQSCCRRSLLEIHKTLISDVKVWNGPGFPRAVNRTGQTLCAQWTSSPRSPRKDPLGQAPIILLIRVQILRGFNLLWSWVDLSRSATSTWAAYQSWEAGPTVTWRIVIGPLIITRGSNWSVCTPHSCGLSSPWCALPYLCGVSASLFWFVGSLESWALDPKVG